MAEPQPTAITANREQAGLQVQWNDGHVSWIPFAVLRAACPCAGCRGGHEHMSSEPDPAAFQVPLANSARTRIAQIEPVGGYGITLTWQDGHHHGIYNWHYLRALCGCDQCRPEAARHG